MSAACEVHVTHSPSNHRLALVAGPLVSDHGSPTLPGLLGKTKTVVVHVGLLHETASNEGELTATVQVAGPLSVQDLSHFTQHLEIVATHKQASRSNAVISIIDATTREPLLFADTPVYHKGQFLDKPVLLKHASKGGPSGIRVTGRRDLEGVFVRLPTLSSDSRPEYICTDLGLFLYYHPATKAWHISEKDNDLKATAFLKTPRQRLIQSGASTQDTWKVASGGRFDDVQLTLQLWPASTLANGGSSVARQLPLQLLSSSAHENGAETGHERKRSVSFAEELEQTYTYSPPVSGRTSQSPADQHVSSKTSDVNDEPNPLLAALARRRLSVDQQEQLEQSAMSQSQSQPQNKSPRATLARALGAATAQRSPVTDQFGSPSSPPEAASKAPPSISNVNPSAAARPDTAAFRQWLSAALSSEKNYGKRLVSVIDKFINDRSCQKHINETHRQQIFRNIQKLYDVSSGFVASLKDMLSDLDHTTCWDRLLSSTVPDTLTALSRELLVYCRRDHMAGFSLHHLSHGARHAIHQQQKRSKTQLIELLQCPISHLGELLATVTELHTLCSSDTEVWQRTQDIITDLRRLQMRIDHTLAICQQTRDILGDAKHKGRFLMSADRLVLSWTRAAPLQRGSHASLRVKRSSSPTERLEKEALSNLQPTAKLVLCPTEVIVLKDKPHESVLLPPTRLESVKTHQRASLLTLSAGRKTVTLKLETTDAAIFWKSRLDQTDQSTDQQFDVSLAAVLRVFDSMIELTTTTSFQVPGMSVDEVQGLRDRLRTIESTHDLTELTVTEEKEVQGVLDAGRQPMLDIYRPAVERRLDGYKTDIEALERQIAALREKTSACQRLLSGSAPLSGQDAHVAEAEWHSLSLQAAVRRRRSASSLAHVGGVTASDLVTNSPMTNASSSGSPTSGQEASTDTVVRRTRKTSKSQAAAAAAGTNDDIAWNGGVRRWSVNVPEVSEWEKRRSSSPGLPPLTPPSFSPPNAPPPPPETRANGQKQMPHVAIPPPPPPPPLPATEGSANANAVTASPMPPPAAVTLKPPEQRQPSHRKTASQSSIEQDADALAEAIRRLRPTARGSQLNNAETAAADTNGQQKPTTTEPTKKGWSALRRTVAGTTSRKDSEDGSPFLAQSNVKPHSPEMQPLRLAFKFESPDDIEPAHRLFLKRGDRVFLLDKTDANWCLVETERGRQGLCPRAYLVPEAEWKEGSSQSDATASRRDTQASMSAAPPGPPPVAAAATSRTSSDGESSSSSRPSSQQSKFRVHPPPRRASEDELAVEACDDDDVGELHSPNKDHPTFQESLRKFKRTESGRLVPMISVLPGKKPKESAPHAAGEGDEHNKDQQQDQRRSQAQSVAIPVVGGDSQQEEEDIENGIEERRRRSSEASVGESSGWDEDEDENDEDEDEEGDEDNDQRSKRSRSSGGPQSKAPSSGRRLSRTLSSMASELSVLYAERKHQKSPDRHSEQPDHGHDDRHQLRPQRDQNLDATTSASASATTPILPTEKHPFIALYSFSDSDEPEAIDMEEGDKLVLVAVEDKGWMRARNTRTGETGIVPASYLGTEDEYREVQREQQQQQQQKEDDQPDHATEEDPSEQQPGHTSSDSEHGHTDDEVVVRVPSKVRAKFAYTENDGKGPFTIYEGEQLDVVEDLDDNWALVQRQDGTRGEAPWLYLDRVDE